VLGAVGILEQVTAALFRKPPELPGPAVFAHNPKRFLVVPRVGLIEITKQTHDQSFL